MRRGCAAKKLWRACACVCLFVCFQTPIILDIFRLCCYNQPRTGTRCRLLPGTETHTGAVLFVLAPTVLSVFGCGAVDAAGERVPGGSHAKTASCEIVRCFALRCASRCGRTCGTLVKYPWARAYHESCCSIGAASHRQQPGGRAACCSGRRSRAAKAFSSGIQSCRSSAHDRRFGCSCSR